ncbi:Ribosomal protein S19 [Methanonatronarchaeum thermophilum]|uniref:Small ribosomal subunit protein uS19 n=1 Tax=Methanonatronarchaeum thermophilum TaxID=1927129 RepID=A0A1Y3GBL4_9EURY|nr:30S ribosomal protein S19 [Methanonatronarchaeum thermophilum]OUJ18842.1 Ribosomal protein S19 [Methanonatronarchaeum thermophilum]
MVREEFKYRGYTLEELKEMNLDELKEILPSRARRKIERGLNEEEKKLLEEIRELQDSSEDIVVKTHLRDMIILPEFVTLKIGIHNGNDFEVIRVEPEMIGHFIGEFATTRKDVKHGGPGIGATRSSKYVPLK